MARILARCVLAWCMHESVKKWERGETVLLATTMVWLVMCEVAERARMWVEYKKIKKLSYY
jgi:hypothetical protein